ncbi:MAG: hypothetical protein AMXMBFR81_16220 [Chthonomonas sp.]
MVIVMRVQTPSTETVATPRPANPAGGQGSLQLKMLKQALDAQKLQAQMVANQLQGKGQVIDIEA